MFMFILLSKFFQITALVEVTENILFLQVEDSGSLANFTQLSHFSFNHSSVWGTEKGLSLREMETYDKW